jgi:hypothetical protein
MRPGQQLITTDLEKAGFEKLIGINKGVGEESGIPIKS